MKEITLKIDDKDFKRLEEIQEYFGWNYLVSAGEISLLLGIAEVEKTIAFDKEKKGK